MKILSQFGGFILSNINTYQVLIVLLLFLVPVETSLAQEVIKEEAEPQREEKFSNHHVFFSTGISFRTAPMPEGIDGEIADHINGLKNGFNIQAGFAFFPGPNIGPSLKYMHFFSTNTTRNLNTDIKILFFGGGVSTRTFTSSGTILNADMHIGYVAYRELDTDTNGGLSVKHTGNTVGIEGSVILDILLSKSISLQLKAGYQTAVLKKITDPTGNNLELEDPESLDRIDLNTGLKIHF